MNQDVNAYLFGGGGKAASFENIGDKVSGTITNVELQQQTDLEENKPLFWDNGQPRMILVITLETDLRDDEEDDGIRRLYAKGGKFETETGSGKAMKDAIADAVKAAGAKSIDEGGQLAIGHTGLAKKKTRGHNAAKLFTAQYKPPTTSVAASDLFED